MGEKVEGKFRRISENLHPIEGEQLQLGYVIHVLTKEKKKLLPPKEIEYVQTLCIIENK